MKLDIKTKIDRFVAKHPEPYQFGIKLEWQRKDGWHNATFGNGKLLFTRNTSSRPFTIQHYLYDKQLQMLEIAYAVFDCHTPKEGKDKKWVYADRYFVPKGTKDLYNINGLQKNYHIIRASYDTYTNWQSEFIREFTNCDYDIDMFRREFVPFIGNDTRTIGSWRGNITNNSYPWEIRGWFAAKPKERTNGPTQLLIDKLTKNEFEPLDESIFKGLHRNRSWRQNRAAWLDLKNKVFRCFIQDGDNWSEEHRIFLTDKKIVVAYKNKDNEWVPNGSFSSCKFDHAIINLQDVYKLPYCSYLEKIISTTDEPSLYTVVSAMKCTEIEQLTNMGLIALAKYFFHNDYKAANMKDIFGEPTRKKNVCQKYGVSKKQLEYINTLQSQKTSYYKRINMIGDLKVIMNTNNIASIDYDTFIKYMNVIKNIQNYNMWFFSRNDGQKIFLKLVNWTNKSSDASRVFFDTYNTYNYLSREYKPTTSPIDIKSYDELVRMHDTCVELKRIQQAEQRRLWDMQEAERHALLEKKMAKLDAERVKWNYQDDHFTIRLPEKLSEIVNEGSDLHHCVGGYTDRHASGSTTIMFLRKNDEPNTSFYTIEVNNDKIVQIHGFGNKWLGNNPEAIPTVMRWLKANNIHCDDNILLSTAKGYHSGDAPLVAKPII